MKRNLSFLSLLLLVSGSVSLQADDIVSTAASQKDIAVTAYNKNLALVRDRRTISIPEGEHALTFMDVAEQIKPETVALKSLSSPGSLTILEQNYIFDLMSPSKLLDKHVGKEVELVNFSKDTGFDRKKVRLLSNNNGPIYMTEDGKIYLDHPGSVVVPEIPDNLVERPSLVWLLDNKDPQQEQEVEVNYLTNGIQWNADYVVKLDKTDDNLDLQGWVTLTNNSGATYKNALLKLIAGDINIAQHQPAPMYERAFMMKAAAMDAGMQAEAFGDFHMYTVPRRTTIFNNQTKQVNLLHAADVKAQKHYEYQGQGSYFYGGAGTQKNQKVAVYLTFKNDKENGSGLGVPLPAGVMRVYQEDSTGALQFSGEDRIEHTPKNEEVKLKLGNAFDINVDRVQTKFDMLGNRNNPLYESSHKITIRNHKDIPVTVDVIEPMSGKWTITESSHKYTQSDSHTVRFSIEVPAEGSAELTYSVRIQNQ